MPVAMTNQEYISLHRHDDVRQLALRRMPQGVDAVWCLQQIEGWQLARLKLPLWADNEGLWFPPRLSMEQCSSQPTAEYKARVVERLLPSAGERTSMADLTGGYGVDFSFMAPLFGHALYVERSEALCDIARHNFKVLGLDNAEVICGESNEESGWLRQDHSLIYLDPARRDGAGRKTVALADCTPDVTRLLPLCLSCSRHVMVKLSPMHDISEALRLLPSVAEVHVVSVRGECKELLLVCGTEKGGVSYHCVNVSDGEMTFVCDESERQQKTAVASVEMVRPDVFLCEPNASVLKAGVQDALACRHGLLKLHPMSNLFVGEQLPEAFPGRSFRIMDCSDFNKKNLARLLDGIGQANITIRNVPSTVAALRKRLKLREGGDTYLFATTLADGSHVLVRCVKASLCHVSQ